VRTYAGDNAVVIEIKDNGIGMTVETQERIFERFYRLDNAHTNAGFGLGLPIAQKVINSHHGEIVVESQLGRGSCFRIYLPVADGVNVTKSSSSFRLVSSDNSDSEK
jgi:two-component system phosphate regulon sensor histidine kinase PhoR